MAKPIHVATSPLTNTIYAGALLKDGQTWAAGTTDVTGMACAAVAQHALAKGGTITVNGNGQPMYEITVRDLLQDNPQDYKALLNWLEENEFDLVTRREPVDEDEYLIYWFVVDSRKSTPQMMHSISGHPLESPIEAIIQAMKNVEDAKSKT